MRLGQASYTSTAAATGAKLGQHRYHSNIHLGELHWSNDPNDQYDTPKPSLEVEVDYIQGRNPFAINVSGNMSVIEAMEKNFRFYGLSVQFYKDEGISKTELKQIPKEPQHVSSQKNITPSEFNRYEIDIIEDFYHQNQNRMHMFWGTKVGSDSPGTIVDRHLSNYGPADAITFTNGAPLTDKWDDTPQPYPLTRDGTADFGVMIGTDEMSTDELQSVTLHEIGHALGAGWADDDMLKLEYHSGSLDVSFAPVPYGLEAYSGDVDGSRIGVDGTPEYVHPSSGGKVRVTWSIMKWGIAINVSRSGMNIPLYPFSIEELSTIDIKHIPSKD